MTYTMQAYFWQILKLFFFHEFLIIKECQKSAKKYACTVTVIAQPQKFATEVPEVPS